jgi:hypothetical protein
MKPLLLLIAALPTLAATGGSDRGGGNALVCFDSPSIPQAIRTPGNPSFGVIPNPALKHITKIEMLDVYQAKLPRPGQQTDRLGAPAKGESPEGFAERLLDRIANFAPGVHQKILQGKFSLRGNVQFSDRGVATIDDVNLLFDFDRVNCVIATMAAQDGQNDALFVDSRLYNHPKNSVASRAVMWLHEWTYYTLLRNGATTSAGVRGIVGKMIISGDRPVKELIDTAVKAGLIKAGRESLNGIEAQMQSKFDLLVSNISYDADFNWYTGECKESLCDVFWKFRKQYEETLRGFQPVTCYNIVDCENELTRVVKEATDPDVKRTAEHLLEETTSYRKQLQIGAELRKTLLPAKFEATVGEGYGKPALPAEDLAEAAKQFTWAVETVASSVDSFAVNWAPIGRYSTFPDYQSAMRVVRDDTRKQAIDFSSTTNVQFPFLALPFLDYEL